jgi:hypothetical protein
MNMVRVLVAVVALSAAAGAAQKPVPFPQPAQPAQKPPVSTPQTPAQPGTPPSAAPSSLVDEPVPTEATLGAPLYPNAQFLSPSFNAGMGQRYYLFGTNSAFADIVAYYRTALKQRGELVFEDPPVHEFDLGRFREETMAFPPSVTVKDYASGGLHGYLYVSSKPGVPPARFKTIIQIVPLTPGMPK